MPYWDRELLTEFAQSHHFHHMCGNASKGAVPVLRCHEDFEFFMGFKYRNARWNWEKVLICILDCKLGCIPLKQIFTVDKFTMGIRCMRGPFYWHISTEFQTWISHYIHSYLGCNTHPKLIFNGGSTKWPLVREAPSSANHTRTAQCCYNPQKRGHDNIVRLSFQYAIKC